MPAHLDHLLWASRDLDVAVKALHATSGVRASFGGRHPELGTHNALARLGDQMFLEVLAPDPTLEAGTLARRLAALADPVLLMWAARVKSAAAVAAKAEDEGYQAVIVPGHRPHPNGDVVRWTNVFVSGHGAGTMVPFFIEWHTTPHPADDAARGLELEAFWIETPEPESLRAVLTALDVKASVRRGRADRLVARLDTPRGQIVLTGPESDARPLTARKRRSSSAVLDR